MKARPVTLIASALLLAGCGKEPPPAPVVRPVLTQVVAARGADAAAVYSGEVRARHESDLAFRIGGKVIARNVEVGALVKRGTVLARLDREDAQLNVEAGRAQLASAEADLSLARAELDRYRPLREQNFVSQAVLDARQNAYNATEARVRQLRAQLGVSQNSAGYATLVADTDGVITLAAIEPGQVVTAGQAVFRLARLDEKEVLINVPEGRLADWKNAPGIAVALWTQPDKIYAGRLREIAPNADQATRTFNTRVSILNADAEVRLGMTATVILAAGAAAKAIVIPLTALSDENGRAAVWVVDGKTNQVKRQPIELGAYREDGVVVTSGLAGGETIVTAGVHKLLPGEYVRLIEPAHAADRRSSQPVR